MFVRRFFCLALIVIAVPSFAEHVAWPEFRGPTGDGKVAEAHLPIAIDKTVVQWQTPIHGKGWSSPVVWEDQIWLTTATEDGKRMSVVCVDRHSGKILHDRVLIENEDPSFCHPMNSYATPTPAIEAGRVYVHFGRYLTACLDTKDASLIWQRRGFQCDHYRGPASSPILHDGKLFVAYDGVDVQYVVAFDKQTGQTVWQTQRDIDYGTDVGDQMKAYGTAEVIQVEGRDMLVYPSAVATIAYDPANGDAIWTVYHGGMNASARPLYAGGLVLITNGSGGMVAVKPDGLGDITGSGVVWTSKQSVPKKASPIVLEDLVFMVSDEGILTCRDLATGKVIWKERLTGTYAASPLFADGRIYFFGIEGDILTLDPGETYKPLAQTKLGDGFMASPAVVEDQMILRSKSMLYSIESPNR
ncbi:PQQ-like beta-propeller repeat protein [Novipirellula artificiosorum]|uniref:Outer membrane biogenesis protein BamB n=1 Tax=Novipirellula artificiosorum TaxID=2528016 RepID=A0A5C6DJG2_9BACT|nr:PQQ-like beta-propeller repeat protein [Novipirellula artificiosorum]TWU36047.1 outer membrane biogenesis protein BamB [Novipirellula artificiosorum]